jgi:subtilisin family serine protease
VGVTALLAAGIAALPTSAAAAPAPLLGTASSSAIPGQYVVVLKDSTALEAAGFTGSTSAVVADAVDRGRKLGAQVRFTYASAAVRGYSAQLSSSELAQVRADGAVSFVQANLRYHATDEGDDYSTTAAQSRPWWGLDRIDQHNLPLNKRYYYNRTGSGVTAYVVDTGINYSHREFTGRIATGFDASGGDGSDCAGHGTHVAGTLAGTTYGVAKHATIVPVRVLDCNGAGSTDTVAAGLNWISDTHSTRNPAVANMSLTSNVVDRTIDAAVNRLLHDRVSVVVAAGNGDQFGNGISACSISPSNVKGALTVGATTVNDRRTTWSNYGSCVDLFAPGNGIRSAWVGSNSAVRTISGTSMASPHVAGAVALYLQGHPAATPSQVASAINTGAVQNKVTNVSSAWPRRLLFSVLG